MTDDLVKRARHNALADMPHYASVELIEALADRIEELESELSEYKHVASAIDTQWAESQDEIADLKDKLARALETLQYYAHDDDDGGWLAKSTLAEITGGKDE